MAESLPAFNPSPPAGEVGSLFGTEVGWLTVALVALAALVIVCWRWPFRFLVRLPCYAGSRLLYRMRVLSAENLPKRGPALICSNHVSYLDWVFLLAAVQRPIRFVIFTALTRPVEGTCGPRQKSTDWPLR